MERGEEKEKKGEGERRKKKGKTQYQGQPSTQNNQKLMNCATVRKTG